MNDCQHQQELQEAESNFVTATLNHHQHQSPPTQHTTLHH